MLNNIKQLAPWASDSNQESIDGVTLRVYKNVLIKKQGTNAIPMINKSVMSALHTPHLVIVIRDTNGHNTIVIY